MVTIVEDEEQYSKLELRAIGVLCVEVKLFLFSHAAEHGAVYNAGWEYSFRVKWDGCIDWELPPNRFGHLCSIYDVDTFRKQVAWVYDEAKKLMPAAIYGVRGAY